jgi:hypothetical protein
MISLLGERGAQDAIDETLRSQPENEEGLSGPHPEPDLDPRLDPSVNPRPSSAYVATAAYERVEGAPFIRGGEDRSDIAPNDVRQGQLGNCYFLAGLAALARANPERVRSRITDHGDGTYTVKLHEGGDVVVDSQFPMRHGSTAFAGKGDEGPSGEAELWVMLIEKAWAKSKGEGYEEIRGSKVRMKSPDAMQAVAGGKTRTLRASTAKEEDLFAAMGRAQDKGWGATLAVKNVTSPEDIRASQEAGLVPNHAYAIVDVDMERRTVKVYNPWGEEHEVPTLSMDTLRKHVHVVHINEQPENPK